MLRSATRSASGGTISPCCSVNTAGSVLGPFRPVVRLFSRFFAKDKALYSSLTRIVGAAPDNLLLYEQALTPVSSVARMGQQRQESNERLEFLGDAILGSVVAEYLFRKYPYKDEGFLTEIRSRIVNRESL